MSCYFTAFFEATERILDENKKISTINDISIIV